MDSPFTPDLDGLAVSKECDGADSIHSNSSDVENGCTQLALTSNTSKYIYKY